MDSMLRTVRMLLPGLTASICVALAASYLADQFGGPKLLLALLLGSTFNYLAALPETSRGIEYSAKHVLRLGVALLGARITYAEVAAIGDGVVTFTVLTVTVVIGAGYWLGRSARLPRELAMVSAGAVAICGASAALAIASVLPRRADLEQQTIVIVAVVTTLSTGAMMLYPLIANLLQFDPREAGIFIGATVHDVAQVVAAAYMLSPESGDVATIIKLLRVTCLLPVLLVAGLLFRAGHWTPATRRAVIPWFLIGFVSLVAAGSAGWISTGARGLLDDISRLCLLVAVAALGMRTSLAHFAAAGPAVTTAIVMQSLLLMVCVAAGLTLL